MGWVVSQIGSWGLWSLWAKGRAVGNPMGGEVRPRALSTAERSERPGARRASSTNPWAGSCTSLPAMFGVPLLIDACAKVLGIDADEIYAQAGRLPPDLRPHLKEIVVMWRNREIQP